LQVQPAGQGASWASAGAQSMARSKEAVMTLNTTGKFYHRRFGNCLCQQRTTDGSAAVMVRMPLTVLMV
jgi:hypothetical protein